MADSDLSSTMGSSFTGTDMGDMASPGGSGGSAPTGLSSMRAKLKNAFASDKDSSGSDGKAAGAPAAPPPSLYGGIQSTMTAKLKGDS